MSIYDVAVVGAALPYKKSWLWHQAFDEPRSDASSQEQIYFRELYCSMREKAAALVGRIACDMMGMTVHDVTHLDALWEMGSIVSDGAVKLNPPEAFVFGGAVLLHDAAMSLAAFQNGLASLKENTAWKDCYARLKARFLEEDVVPDEEMIEKMATAEALRKLHALQAEKLPTMAWHTANTQPEYLINDPEIRNFYGPKIGRIAHSHWWSVAQVDEELAKDLGPLGGRTGNRIDLIKIACLLRVADAMHLDQRRAPPFLRSLLNPQGISQSHWEFQSRMAVPYIQNSALIYSAAPTFDLSVTEAWWLVFDALTMVDRELREVDHLLQKRGTGRLTVNRVEGVSRPTDLARYIETDGWLPVDSTVRVSDVPKIVATLGGSKLYGDKPVAAIRELIQNAADAVVARRKLQKRPANWGAISITLESRGDDHWLIVEDNGIGMSPAVLTGPLIDFGNSFWRSPLAAEEFPGIQAAGISAIGKYGIGFFSVFMLGSLVRVTSRRYDKASDSVRTLEFQNGLGSRPILYDPGRADMLIDGGTRVEVRLSQNPRHDGGFLHNGNPFAKNRMHLKYVIASLAPSLAVEVITREAEDFCTAIKAKDWLALDEGLLMARLAGGEPENRDSGKAKPTRLRPLLGEDGVVYGRAMIETTTTGSGRMGCISVGGLRSSGLSMIRGVVLGHEVTASRNEARPVAPSAVLAKWATEQAALIHSADLPSEDQARAAQVVLSCRGDIGNLPVARFAGEWLNSDALVTVLRLCAKVLVFYGDVSYDADSDEVHPKYFSNHFEEDGRIIFVPTDVPGYFWGNSKRFLGTAPDVGVPANLTDMFRFILEREWGNAVSEREIHAIVGNAIDTDIIREVTVFERFTGSDEVDSYAPDC